jgi:hypothetical protein
MLNSINPSIQLNGRLFITWLVLVLNDNIFLAFRRYPNGAQYFRGNAVVYAKTQTIVTIFLQNDISGLKITKRYISII